MNNRKLRGWKIGVLRDQLVGKIGELKMKGENGEQAMCQCLMGIDTADNTEYIWSMDHAKYYLIDWSCSILSNQLIMLNIV